MSEKRPRLRIRDIRHAAEIARDLKTVREGIAAAQELADWYREGLAEWMRNHGGEPISQERHETLILLRKIGGYEWNVAGMTDEELALLRREGLLTVRTGAYDELVKRSPEPLGLKRKYAQPQYRTELRFEAPPPSTPRLRRGSKNEK